MLAVACLNPGPPCGPSPLPPRVRAHPHFPVPERGCPSAGCSVVGCHLFAALCQGHCPLPLTVTQEGFSSFRGCLGAGVRNCPQTAGNRLVRMRQLFSLSSLSRLFQESNQSKDKNKLSPINVTEWGSCKPSYSKIQPWKWRVGHSHSSPCRVASLSD